MKDSFSVDLDGQSRSILMTFGLLDEISGLIGSAENVPLLALDRDTRNKMLRIMLSTRDDEGKIVKEFNPMTSLVSMATINELVSWSAEHVLSFFLTSLEGAARLAMENKDRMENLTASLTGSVTSTSPKRSAGASTPSPAS